MYQLINRQIPPYILMYIRDYGYTHYAHTASYMHMYMYMYMYTDADISVAKPILC